MARPGIFKSIKNFFNKVRDKVIKPIGNTIKKIAPKIAKPLNQMWVKSKKFLEPLLDKIPGGDLVKMAADFSIGVSDKIANMDRSGNNKTLTYSQDGKTEAEMAGVSGLIKQGLGTLASELKQQYNTPGSTVNRLGNKIGNKIGNKLGINKVGRNGAGTVPRSNFIDTSNLSKETIKLLEKRRPTQEGEEINSFSENNSQFDTSKDTTETFTDGFSNDFSEDYSDDEFESQTPVFKPTPIPTPRHNTPNFLVDEPDNYYRPGEPPPPFITKERIKASAPSEIGFLNNPLNNPRILRRNNNVRPRQPRSGF